MIYGTYNILLPWGPHFAWEHVKNASELSLDSGLLWNPIHYSLVSSNMIENPPFTDDSPSKTPFT